MRGIWPILYAYFDATGALDRSAMRLQVEAARRCRAPGVAILGLATEVNKLSADEKRHLIRWAVEDLGGAAPLAVTISGATVGEQLALARDAIDAGAAFLVLQPPARPGGPIGEAELECFFGDVLQGVAMVAPELPVGIQNAPEFLGVGLSVAGLARLREARPNLRFLKGEAPAAIIERTVEALGAGFPVLNGRGGMELVDNLRAGCAGMIVAPDCAWEQQKIADSFARGALAEAEAQYAWVLPAIVFVMQSLDTLVVYGKRIAAWRMGFDVVHDRRCTLAPTPFGVATARRIAGELGPLPGCALFPDPDPR